MYRLFVVTCIPCILPLCASYDFRLQKRSDKFTFIPTKVFSQNVSLKAVIILGARRIESYKVCVKAQLDKDFKKKIVKWSFYTKTLFAIRIASNMIAAVWAKVNNKESKVVVKEC